MIERGKPGGGAGRVLTEPATVRLMRDAENPWYEVVLTEGRNRQIRKLFEEIGHHVEKIRRVGYGTLVLDVPPGEVRELEPRKWQRWSVPDGRTRRLPSGRGYYARSRSGICLRRAVAGKNRGQGSECQAAIVSPLAYRDEGR